jgi:hypothetical protein
MKLFDDKETFQKERPLCLPNSHFRTLCERLAKEIVSERFHKDVKQVTHDLELKVNFSENGYEIARSLDDDSVGYTINSMFVEHLDSLGYERDNALEELVKQWVEAHKPTPKYKVGDKIILTSNASFTNKKDKVMYINKIKKDTAQYAVHEDPNYGGGYMYAYEKLDPITKISK